MTDLEKFGEFVMAKCRDEIMDGHNSLKLSDYKNFENIGDEQLRVTLTERKQLLDSLTSEQMQTLDKLILSTVDNFAFCFLRQLQENKSKNYGNNTFDIIVNGRTSFEMERDLISGNLFGDYLAWVERKSKYGAFQH